MSSFEILSQSLSIVTAKIKNSEAEETSLYHDLSSWRFPQSIWLRAKDVRNLLIAVSFLGFPDNQQNDFRDRAHKIAERYNFEGQWKEVEDLLQLNSSAPGRIIQWYLESHSPEDWFGDTLKRTIKIMRLAKHYNPYLPTKHPVRYPERKRGYNDKGSLSRYDKLRREHFARDEKEITMLDSLKQNSFYPSWYTQEKHLKQTTLMEELLFPEVNEKENDNNDKSTKKCKKQDQTREVTSRSIKSPSTKRREFTYLEYCNYRKAKMLEATKGDQ